MTTTPRSTDGVLSRLSPRERIYVLVLVLTFFVMGTVVLLYMRGQALRDTRSEIEVYRMALGKVFTRGAVYQELLAGKQARESDIATEQILFSTLLEDAQRGIEGLSVSDQEERPPTDLGGGLVKRTFEFRLRSVSLENAAKFLAAIESKAGRVILTEELVVRSPSSTDDRLNIEVTLATWERTANAADLEEES